MIKVKDILVMEKSDEMRYDQYRIKDEMEARLD